MSSAFFQEVMKSGTEMEKLLLTRVRQAILSARDNVSTHLHEMIGLKGRWVEEKKFQFETEVTPFLFNLNQAVHGGVLAYIADTTMGSMVFQSLPPGKISVTSEIKMNYIRAVHEGKLTTNAELLHLGKRTAVAECKMFAEEGELITVSSASFAILDTESVLKKGNEQ